MDIYPADEKGRRVTNTTLNKWMREYGWRERAEDIQIKAIEKVNDEIINLKANLLREQFENGKDIAMKAKQFLMDNGFDSAASAVSAYFSATKEQRLAVGIWEILEKMNKMTDEQLEREILDRVRRASESGQIIDGEEINENDADE